MNKSSKITLFCAGISLFSQHGFAQQNPADLDSLNRRMNSLENKVDTLVDLLQKQQSGQQAPATNQQNAQAQPPGPANAPDGFVSGMFLDIYASGIIVANPREDTTLDFPSGSPDASTKVAPQATMSYGQFLKIKETQSLGGVSDSLVAVSYSSYLSIEKPGPHVFQIRTHKERSSHSKRCVTQLLMADKTIISKDNHESDVSTAQTNVKLTPGLYKINVLLACGVDYNFKNLSSFSLEDYQSVAVDLLMGEPGDHAPQPISPDRLLIKE